MRLINTTIDLMGALCEIRTQNNDLLMIGKIDEVEERYVQVSDKNPHFLYFSYGTRVNAQIYSTSDDFAYIEGNAYLTEDKCLRITDIIFITTEERRNFFRIEVNQPAKALGRDSSTFDEVLVNSRYTPWKDAFIENISLSGIRVRSEENLEKESYIMVQLPQINNRIFIYRIVRKNMPKDGEKQYSYGCELVNDRCNRHTDELCSYIFECQRNAMGKMKDKTE